ncbi:MAG: glutamate-1-semialdehyde 2,1-aminomutase [Candidatus Omnitrophota bacterium]
MVKAINKQLFAEAKKYIAGGVNSPVRSFRSVGGTPIFIKSGKGAKIYSENGRSFIDYNLSWGVLILGHSHPKVIGALKKAIDNGASFGASTKAETELAKIIIKAIPSIERIRLVNSGTEAVMSAIRLARAFTKKNKVVKFEGSYHGHADYLLDCPGVPEEFKKDTLTAPYNNLKIVQGLVKRHKNNIAAIIVEPVAGNMGVVLPEEGFLQGLRKIADKHKIVLIFDEVVTGFRLTFGGAQKVFNVKPDLTCLGKIIGGGLPIGAFGGRKKIMDMLAPLGPVYQAGTFSGNPLSVNAGLATLKILSAQDPYRRLTELTRRLCEGIKDISAGSSIKLRVNRVGSMFSVFFANRDVIDYNTARNQDTGLLKKFFHGLLEQGVYLSPSGFEANFLSTAHTAQDIDKTLKALGTFLKLNIRCPHTGDTL